MGAVYEATQLRLNKRVAIKVMARELAANPEALARFRREAEVTSGMGHPHIVQVFDFGATPTGEPFLAMEFLEGEDLEHRLRRDGRLSLSSTIHIIKQVASALAATHGKGVVHRDLKPANIYLLAAAGEADFVKVLDFGISKVRAATTKLTKVSMVMGTPNYMSPEQALGRVDEIDDRTDQWALACIAWECLSGAGPFVGDSVPSILFQVVHEAPPPLASKVPGLHPEVGQVLLRALAKKKEDRYPNVAAFSLALEHSSAKTSSPALAARQPELVPATLAADSPLASASSSNGASPPEVNRPRPTTFTQSAGAMDAIDDEPRPSRSRWFWAGGVGVAVMVLMGTLLLFRPQSVPQPASSVRASMGTPSQDLPVPFETPQPPSPAASTDVDSRLMPVEATTSVTSKKGSKRKRGGEPLAAAPIVQGEPRGDLPQSNGVLSAPAPAPQSGRDDIPKGGSKW
jgi:serine/threonine-protein kinase